MNIGTHDFGAKGRLGMLAALVRRLNSASGAQSIVEFAIAMPVVLITLLAGIQFAIIGAAALALGQANYQGARYAAVNTSADQTAVKNYMLSVASPTISANSGAYLSVSLNPAPPCDYGNAVTVSVTYNASHLLALPNPFLGLFSFPTTLSNSETAFCEGSTN